MAVELITDGEIDAALGCAERAMSVDGASELSTRATAAVVRTAALLLKGSREEARLSLLDALTRTAPQELLYLLSAGLIAGPGLPRAPRRGVATDRRPPVRRDGPDSPGEVPQRPTGDVQRPGSRRVGRDPDR